VRARKRRPETAALLAAEQQSGKPVSGQVVVLSHVRENASEGVDADGMSVEIIGSGENRVAKGARDEAAFRRFLDREDDLARILLVLPS
jgi:hypothetical protein